MKEGLYMQRYLIGFLILPLLFAIPVSCLGQERSGQLDNAQIIGLNNQPLCGIPQQVPSEFTDIHEHWAKSDIQAVCKSGLMSGMGVNQLGLKVFSPDSSVSQAQLASVLQRTFQLDYGQLRFIKQPLVSDYYSDVNNDAWYANAAMLCAINKIFDDGNNFKPNQNVTRIEIAQAVQRCFNAKKIDIPMILLMPVYQDMQGLSQEQTNALVFVNNTGIMKGDGQNFRPLEGVKRAELARILNRCTELLELNTEVSKKVDESYNGKTLNLQAGDTFVLSLDSNPTTGYTWNLDDSWNEKMLTLVDQGYQSSTTSNIVGQGGRHYWKFKALKAGSADLKVYYARPWESVQPLKTFQVKIIINPMDGTK